MSELCKRIQQCIHHNQKIDRTLEGLSDLKPSTSSEYTCSPVLVKRHEAEARREKLVEELKELPSSWSLTPVKNKVPLRSDWQSEPIIPLGHLAHILLNGQEIWSEKKQRYFPVTWNGYGLRTGPASGGILAIDEDGLSAAKKLAQMSDGDVPRTVSFSSGKSGRKQSLFQLSEALQRQLEETGFTHYQITTKPGEQLDFRYRGCQSVLPPSAHPETGQYYWINSPVDYEVAPAPAWLEEFLSDLAQKKEKTAQQAKPGQHRKQNSQSFNLMGRIHWTGPAQSNQNLGAIVAYCVEVEGLLDPEEIENRAWQLARAGGYEKWASGQEKRDRGHLRRWIRSKLGKSIGGWTGNGGGNRNLNDERSEDANYRLQTILSKIQNQIWRSATDLFKQVHRLSKELFGIGISKSTFWNRKEFWENLIKRNKPSNKNPDKTTLDPLPKLRKHTPQENTQLSNGNCSYSPEQQGIQRFEPPSEGTNKPLESKPLFKKGDRVIVDDWTHGPYCGQEVIITAVTRTQDYILYRLNIDFQGRLQPLKKRKNCVEALPSFLKPAPSTQEGFFKAPSLGSTRKKKAKLPEPEQAAYWQEVQRRLDQGPTWTQTVRQVLTPKPRKPGGVHA